MKKLYEIMENYCTGCAVCANICPKEAIEMKLVDGFYKPNIDTDKCIECRLCDMKCPIVNQNQTYLPHCYAAWADDDIRLKTSSGGAFSILAKEILKRGGVVFGAAWTEDFYVKHIYVENEIDLEKLYRSKYAQSDLNNSYLKVKQFLDLDKYVLFVGTPCQIAGLERFLEGRDINKLILVDFICYYNPSIDIVRRYLDETYGIDKLREFSFRDKTYGWISHSIKAQLKDGIEIKEKKMSSFFRGYFNALYVRKACINCTFSGNNHHSDITLGDFWKIEEHDKTWNDGRGTSMIITNTYKGRCFLESTIKSFKRLESVPFDWIRKGQANCKKPYSEQEYFYDLLKYKSFDVAVEQAIDHKYDIGMVCVQSYKNYGSAFTNFALFNVLKDLKKSVLIITQPLTSVIKPEKNTNFDNMPFKTYEIAEQYSNQNEMRVLNQMCDKFVVGSDQLFNYEIYKQIDGFIKLDWVDDEHKKICYSTSFGIDRILGNLDESIKLKKALSRFSNISLREDTGVEIVRNNFKLEAQRVLDPVFLCEKKHYIQLCQNVRENKKKLFAYILDPNKEKENALQFLADKRKEEFTVYADMWMNSEYLWNCWNIPCNINKKNEEWLKDLMESKFVFTDSYHGMCMAIIFEKQFVVINNKKRGATRFESLLNLLGLENRLFDSVAEFITSYDDINEIDYEIVNKTLIEEKKKGIEWLKQAINN